MKTVLALQLFLFLKTIIHHWLWHNFLQLNRFIIHNFTPLIVLSIFLEIYWIVIDWLLHVMTFMNFLHLKLLVIFKVAVPVLLRLLIEVTANILLIFIHLSFCLLVRFRVLFCNNVLLFFQLNLWQHIMLVWVLRYFRKKVLFIFEILTALEVRLHNVRSCSISLMNILIAGHLGSSIITSVFIKHRCGALILTGSYPTILITIFSSIKTMLLHPFLIVIIINEFKIKYNLFIKHVQ